MKIMLIEHYAGSDKMGMEFRPYYMAREWTRLGHEVVIVAASYTHLRKVNPTVENDFDEELIDGVRYVWLKTPEYHGNNAGRGKNIAAFVLKLLRGAKNMARKYRPDAVIASSTYPLDIWPAAKIAKRAGAGLFFEIHDLWPLTPMEMGHLPKWNPVIMVLQAAENYAYRHADRIISILPNANEYIALRGYDAGKMVYVPNGVLTPGSEQQPAGEDEPAVAALRRLHDEGWFLVGYTGNHSVSNSLEYFIEASRLLRGEKVKIVLVGGGNYKETLVRRAKEAGCEDVLFLDPVPKASMGALLDTLDACYMGLSRSNLFRYGVSPNKMFDYLLAAKPVIYAVEAPNNPVRDADCGVTVPVGDSEKIAAAIRTLRDAGEEGRRAMGERARAYVLKNHNYDMLAKRYLAALEEGRKARAAH